MSFPLPLPKVLSSPSHQQLHDALEVFALDPVFYFVFLFQLFHRTPGNTASQLLLLVPHPLLQGSICPFILTERILFRDSFSSVAFSSNAILSKSETQGEMQDQCLCHFLLACPYIYRSVIVQKVLLLRSHLLTFFFASRCHSPNSQSLFLVKQTLE